jgi:hypothetical protein
LHPSFWPKSRFLGTIQRAKKREKIPQHPFRRSPAGVPNSSATMPRSGPLPLQTFFHPLVSCHPWLPFLFFTIAAKQRTKSTLRSTYALPLEIRKPLLPTKVSRR